MNRRPLGHEPSELPDCTTPHIVYPGVTTRGAPQRGLTLAGFTPVTTGVGAEVSRDLRLALVSPNPGRGAAQLRYRLGSPGRLRLEVFDVAGRLVEVLAEGDHAAGEHSATFHGDGLPGGLYLARLQVAGETLSQRIIRLR